MSEMALALIRKAKEESWKQLDLRNCGIVGMIPEEIAELDDLETFIVSHYWWSSYSFINDSSYFEDDKSFHYTSNRGRTNQALALPPRLPKNLVYFHGEIEELDLRCFEGLANLKALRIPGSKVKNFESIASLIELEILEVAHSTVRDIFPLRFLVNLSQLCLNGTQVSDLSPIAALKNIKVLDLTDSKVASLKYLHQYSDLLHLKIYGIQVKDLTPLGKNLNLRSIEASFSKIVDISVLANFADLKELRLHSCKVVDLQSIGGCHKLEVLDVGGTLVSDISPLRYLKNLKNLNLSRAPVSDFSILSSLDNLEDLNISECSINDSFDISNLVRLKLLNLAETTIEEIAFVSSLPALEDLDLSQTAVSDIAPLAAISTLAHLNISRTQVRDISPLAGILQLYSVDISYSLVEDLSPIRSIMGLFGCEITGCPTLNPPQEIAQRGVKAVLKYWERMEFEGILPLNEAKVILIGEGAAGKTSLVKRLFKEGFNKRQSQTNGILIRKRRYKFGKEEVLVRFWDFGGQEVMHATHKFFLTSRALYLVVLDARKDDKEAEYWLEHVRIYGGASPVLIVINKIDENPSFAVNEKGLRNKFGDRIKGYFRVSCSTKEGIAELEKEICRLINESEDTHTPMPMASRLIKDAVENLKEDFVSYERYRQLCEEHGLLDHEEQMNLLAVLNDLGIALNFEQLKSYNTSVLNPEWLTQAVYRIINSYKAQAQGGEFQSTQVGALLNDKKYVNDPVSPKRYPPEKYEFIAEAMSEFELCYRNPDGKKKSYLMPGLLPPEDRGEKFEKKGCARLIITYPGFLPPSIFPRFMVQMNPWLVKDQSWRTGACLLHQQWQASAMIKWDRNGNRIDIWTSGPGSRRMMEFIRDTLGALNKEFDEINPVELVPLEAGHNVDYLELVGYAKANKEDYFSGILGKNYKVMDLLNGIESENRRMDGHAGKVNVFISYSHAYPQHKQKLVTFLAPFKKSGKIKIWEDGMIQAGQMWEDEIWKAHSDADLVVCLLSAEFIASWYCYDREFGQAMEAERVGAKYVVLVQVEECAWKQVPAISAKQLVPPKPIAKYRNQNTGWGEVMKAIEPIIERLYQQKKNTGALGSATWS